MAKINRPTENITLLATTNYVSNTTVVAATVSGFRDFNSITFHFKFDVTGSAADDKLQCFIQASCDNGTTWTDIVASTDLAESAGDTEQFMTVTRNVDPGTTDDSFNQEDAALSAGTVRRMNWGDKLRVKVKQTEGTALDISLTVKANASW